MLVRMPASFAGTNVDWPSGSEQDLPADEAKRIIDAGFAVPVATVKVERAVAKPVKETR